MQVQMYSYSDFFLRTAVRLALCAAMVFSSTVTSAQEAAPPAVASAKSVPAKPVSVTTAPLKLPAELAAVLKKKYPESVADLRAIENQVQAVTAIGRAATVGIDIGGAAGSGVVVSADGLVLTAGHVVTEPNLPVMFLFADGRRARGVTLGLNRVIDSGMMRITDPGPWPFVPLAKAAELANGEWVITLGQPNGFDSDRAPPVRLGRVLSYDDEVINTDCTLVGGDSGGPLLNLRGELVGIHSRIGRGITSNYHVPVAAYHNDWNRLLASHAWGRDIGVEDEEYSRPLLGIAGHDEAGRAVVTQVFPGLPAEQAGIRVGDVLLAIDETEVTTFRALALDIANRAAGEKLKLKVRRGEAEQVVEVELVEIEYPFPGAPSQGK
jgi:serine protease Do